MDSRQQFEEWLDSQNGNEWPIGEQYSALRAWQAGRASMRDEATSVCENEGAKHGIRSPEGYASLVSMIQP
jgi:hypothetical protein